MEWKGAPRGAHNFYLEWERREKPAVSYWEGQFQFPAEDNRPTTLKGTLLLLAVVELSPEECGPRVLQPALVTGIRNRKKKSDLLEDNFWFLQCALYGAALKVNQIQMLISKWKIAERNNDINSKTGEPVFMDNVNGTEYAVTHEECPGRSDKTEKGGQLGSSLSQYLPHGIPSPEKTHPIELPCQQNMRSTNTSCCKTFPHMHTALRRPIGGGKPVPGVWGRQRGVEWGRVGRMRWWWGRGGSGLGGEGLAVGVPTESWDPFLDLITFPGQRGLVPVIWAGAGPSCSIAIVGVYIRTRCSFNPRKLPATKTHPSGCAGSWIELGHEPFTEDFFFKADV